MAIVIDPPKWAELALNVVQIDSDASENREAILEIDGWAAENGFARVNENWLRQIFREGKRFFRGVCYRLTEEEQRSSSSVCQRHQELLDELPETPHQVD